MSRPTRNTSSACSSSNAAGTFSRSAESSSWRPTCPQDGPRARRHRPPSAARHTQGPRTCRQRPAGPHYVTRPRTPRSGRAWSRPLPRSNAKTLPCGARSSTSATRAAPARRDSLSRPCARCCATSAGTACAHPTWNSRTCWALPTSTSSPTSPAQPASGGASSIRPETWWR